ncbi:bifunctional SulP family inorganic anion transporter/carbonic anhydrase [Mycolicibacterium wolinskyi]|uniref:Carbonic anhydrase n=1 Tax=Mycolicibacterium wolinskyi TaxID=59750 RepID=A0A1X2EZ44_9MYCO|nr:MULTISPECIES: bifunctional SulP family inorganic anion transporter/carbonic anhydrase [Mycolicibacterium]MCV7284963.1 bifunctional SulP family inorganic anion transporter/carbonic anhydrase [Mycolicibacterium wolinskyi]MCV7292087.1 bifunctional SulP family inorganic anion transporter/carbonic anhydrase [Mycolicibacterium goodii]ORX11029.1 carbonic anhydrase [Mycolicibacterium wolinskyi]
MQQTIPLRDRAEAVLRYDLPASLVVFLVALPLSLGIAVASGAPVLAGIIAAIVGGIVAGALGGSPLQVSGPAAGLTVVVAGLVSQFGWAVTCAITVCAGVLQVLFGLSRVARAALAISPVVVHAMLAGIGITIALQQVHVLLGGSSNSSAWANVTELPGQLMSAHGPGLFLGVLVIAILVGWKRMPAAVRKVPGPLVAIVGVTALSVLLPFSSIQNVPRIQLDGSLIDAIALPSLPDGNWGAFAAGVLTVALIASVESLLCAVAVDRMHTGPRTNFDREMLGQGTANMISGAVGGLPVTGVIVRSSSNVAAGARTRASAIMHGVWVLVFALPFAGLAQLIPTAALAGLLIVIGCELVKRAHIETARRTGDLVVYVVTVLGVVFLNLLEGVLIGLALAIALTVWRVVRAKIHAEPVSENTWRVVVEGSCTFLSLPKLTSALATVPTGANVTVELCVDFIDHAAHQAIDEWQRQHVATGGTVDIHDVGAVEMASAVAGPPIRAFTPFDKRSGVVPWSSWQQQENSTSVLDGLATYHRRTAPVLRPHMKELEHAQRPETLFITCTDSRIVPNVITSSGPGDLFTVRNVGNMIPAGQTDASMEAAIAFAVDRLHVSSIVVCGHSSCGAMNALLGNMQPRGTSDEYLKTWLAEGNPTLEAFDDGRHPVARSAAAAGFGLVDQLSMVNIAVQVQTLREHPLAQGVNVIGLFYDIPSAGVLRVTPTYVETLADAA